MHEASLNGASKRERPATADRARRVVPTRLRSLPRAEVLGTRFPVAERLRARLLGLAFLDRASAGPGLLIPRCSSIHTAGMRFPLDVYFLGCDGEALGVRRGVGSWRVIRHRDADSVLEVPAEEH